MVVFFAVVTLRLREVVFFFVEVFFFFFDVVFFFFEVWVVLALVRLRVAASESAGQNATDARIPTIRQQTYLLNLIVSFYKYCLKHDS